jgi:hypothetical protein
MAREFEGSAVRIRAASSQQVARALGLSIETRNTVARRIYEDLALVLALIPDLARWSVGEKRGIRAIIRAKISSNESEYLKKLQKHARLRKAIIALGSSLQR